MTSKAKMRRDSLIKSGAGSTVGKGDKKLPVAGPTSLKHFMLIFLMHACKKVLLISPMFRVGLYMCGVTLGSLITDLVPLPRTYFANRHNIFNQWFVKLGWGWTLLCISPFIYVTSITYCCGRMDQVKKHMLRLGVATAWWYIFTSFFNFVENITGFCNTKGFENKSSCIGAGGLWSGFDVSGHAFLLIHCSLTISHEVHFLRSWSRIPDVIQLETDRPSGRVSPADLQRATESYKINMPLVQVLIVALTMLLILWDIMLFSTILYFHNMPQKLTGGALAIGGWFLTYGLWYTSEDLLSPGLPGKGPLKFIKD